MKPSDKEGKLRGKSPLTIKARTVQPATEYQGGHVVCPSTKTAILPNLFCRDCAASSV